MKRMRFLQRTNMEGEWLLASYRSPRYDEWRWALYFWRQRPHWRRLWPLVWHSRDAWTRDIGFRIPFIGVVNLFVQTPFKGLRHGRG